MIHLKKEQNQAEVEEICLETEGVKERKRESDEKFAGKTKEEMEKEIEKESERVKLAMQVQSLKDMERVANKENLTRTFHEIKEKMENGADIAWQLAQEQVKNVGLRVFKDQWHEVHEENLSLRRENIDLMFQRGWAQTENSQLRVDKTELEKQLSKKWLKREILPLNSCNNFIYCTYISIFAKISESNK